MASSVLRLTHKFYSLELPVKSDSPSAPPNTLKAFETWFPFIYDADLALPRSLEQTDMDPYEPIETREEMEAIFKGDSNNAGIIFNYGNYSDVNWFIGISINGIVVYDGLYKKPEGISAEFKRLASGRRVGAAFIDEAIYGEIGVQDKVEITVIKATTWSPWIYYGRISARQKLAYNLGRDAAGMGGIPESLSPAQAVGVKYFVNSSYSNFFHRAIIPFASAFLMYNPVGGVSFSAPDIYFMADVLDGDGRVAIRSNVSFKILSMSLIESLMNTPLSAAFATTTRADNYRTINYREMDYVGTTYQENRIIKNTNFFIVLERKTGLSDFYNSLGVFFLLTLGGFIDFSTCSFRIYSLVARQTTLQRDSSDINNLAFTIANLGSKAVNPFNREETYYPEDMFDIIRDDIASDKRDREKDESGERRYGFLFLSDMKFANDKEKTKWEDGYEIFVSETENIRTVPGVILLDPVDKNDVRISNAEEVFGEDKIKTLYSRHGTASFGFSFLEMLGVGSGLTLTESSIITENSIVNANVLRSQCLRMFLPIPEIGYDYDGNGITTIVDRLYSFYYGFNPNAPYSDPSMTNLLGSRGSEMRFWRKTCPIGQLYTFNGKILTIQERSEGNYLLKVQIVDEQGESPVLQNEIYVYYENGARSNVGSYTAGSGIVVKFQGRLFYPIYFNGENLSTVLSDLDYISDYGYDLSGIKEIVLGKGMNLNDPNVLTSWYRIRLSTSKDFLSFSTDSVLQTEPIVVIRSNFESVDEEDADTGSINIPNPFSTGASSPGNQFFKISQLAEEVGDYMNIMAYGIYDNDLNLAIGETINIFQTGGEGASKDSLNIVFQEIEFKTSVEEVSMSSGNFEYEILYLPKDSQEAVQLYKFWSAAAFSNNTTSAKVKFNASQNLSFVCRPTFGTSNDSSPVSFDISYPYEKIDLETNWVFTWDAEIWEVASVKKNETRVSFVVNPEGSSSLKYHVFTHGHILVYDTIDIDKDIITIEFRNIGGGQRSIKIGSRLFIHCIKGTSEIDSVPTISDIKINFSSSSSVERVDMDYSSTGGGSSFHLISPTYGYVVLGSRGWYFDLEEGTERSGGSYGTNVVGDLISPFWFVDAFASSSELDKKLIRKASDVDIPSIDIVYGNVGSINTSPHMEVRTIGYTPPPPPAVMKTASNLSKIMERFTIIYNEEDRFNQKYSFSHFKGRDTSDGYTYSRKSLRRNIPVYTGPRYMEDLEVEGGGRFTINQGDKILVELELTLASSENPFNSTSEPIELRSSTGESFSDFGYINTRGDISPQWNTSYNVPGEGEARSLVQVPDTTGITSLQVAPAEEYWAGDVSSAKGLFVDSIVLGQTPSIAESKHGEYFLFFTKESTGGTYKMMGVESKQDCQRWQRPGANKREARFYDPIPILTGFSNPIVLEDPISDKFILFIFNHTQQSIDISFIQRSTLTRTSLGQDEEPETIQQGNSDTEIVLNPSVGSWEEYYKEGMHLKSVLYSSTQYFSAAFSRKGILYLASISENGELRLKSNKIKTDDKEALGEWHDFGVDLFHEDSHLGKIIQDSNQIISITLSYAPIMDSLFFLFALSDKLICYSLPSSITNPASEDINTETDELQERYQSWVNETKPSLAIGFPDDISSDHIDTQGAVEESFTPQMVSQEWSREGIFWVFYVSDIKTSRCIRSFDSGTTWNVYENF